nr:reverse transcriptase domain, reverse transcriptase zinc-binding domain protein [Tanacetum cinerariifolium]
PCIYLGLPIGANMTRCSNWTPLVKRFQKRLSKWKCKALSYGGRLTLIKSALGSLGVYYFSTVKAPITIINKLESLRRNFFWGGNLEERKIAWIAWDKVISPLNKGGLGIGSLKTSNHSLLAKWWWRFLNEENALWRKAIVSIHGAHDGLHMDSPMAYKSGPWSKVINLKGDLLTLSFNLPSVFKRKVENGQTTKFWTDSWLGGEPLCSTFPRLYRLESLKSCLVCERAPMDTATRGNSSNEQPHPLGLLFPWAWRNDSWECTIDDSRLFTVKGMRKHITNLSHTSVAQPFRWNKALPIKINVFSWRASQARQLTRSNLDKRDIDLNSTCCPVCDDAPPRPTPSIVVTTGSNILLPSEIIEPDANKTTIQSRNASNDLTPHTNFSRFRPINRHFGDKPHRRTCKKHSQYRMSRNGDFVIRKGVVSKSGGFRGGVPTNWLQIKHHYDSRYQSHNKRDNKVYKDNVVKTKNVFDREKIKSLIREHEQMKKREEEAALMKNIRSIISLGRRMFEPVVTTMDGVGRGGAAVGRAADTDKCWSHYLGYVFESY